MKAIILAAGYATRMFPLTKEFPKPLLTVAGRPIIDHIIAKVDVADEIDEVIVVTNSKFFAQFKKWRAGCKTKKRVTLVDDLTSTIEDRRGAIGDMHFVVTRCRLESDTLVVGGDNLFDGSLAGFLDYAKQKYGTPIIGAYDIREKALASRYGVLGIDRDNRVVDFAEKPKDPASTLVAMCLYYFPRDKLGLIDEYVRAKGAKCDASGFYIDWLRKKVDVRAYVFGGRWFDIGDPKFYKEAGESYK